MTCIGRNLRILFVLFVQSVIWPLSLCAPIRAVQLSGWGDDDDTFWWRRIITPEPFVWPTEPPFVWPTLDPSIFDRFTPSPDDYPPRNNSDTEIKLIIFLPTVLLSILIFVCKFVVCGKRESSYRSNATLHPPPSRMNAPSQNRAYQPLQNRTGAQSTRNPQGTGNASSGRAPRTSNFGDKPPDYSIVVLSDLSGGGMKFPEVTPKPLETPPPKYDDENLPRF